MNKDIYSNSEVIDYIYNSNKELNNCLIEIINNCTFKCRHCYMPESKFKLMDYNMFKKILDELKKAGCLWILITGGEPLLHPDFRKFYILAKEEGFLVSVNTNGYLINDDIIDLFKKYEPYAVEISLYGYNIKSYKEFTSCEDSFTKVDNNIKKLLENNINLHLKSVLVKQNYKHFDSIIKYAQSFNCPFRYDYVIFPKTNNVCKKANDELLSTDLIIKVLKNDNESYPEFKERYNNINYDKTNNDLVFNCSAGEDSLYIDTYGNISGCIALASDKYNINSISMEKARKEIIKWKNSLIEKNSKCSKCYKKSICRYCPGRFKLETGEYTLPPDWYCNTADSIIRNISVDGILFDNSNKISEKELKMMFKLLKENYNADEGSYLIWSKNVIDAKDTYTYALYDKNKIIAYIQYIRNNNVVCLCEIQIKKEYQGDGKTFKKIMRDFIFMANISVNDIVYGNINPKNNKSISVFTNKGFINSRDNRYEISGKDLINSVLN